MKINKKTKLKSNIFENKLLILFFGITIGFLIFSFVKNTNISSQDQLVFLDGGNKIKSINKPKFLELAIASSSVYSTTKDSIFEISSKPASEAYFELCLPVFTNNSESVSDDCVWDNQNINGNKVNIIHKNTDSGKVVSILIEVKGMSVYSLRIDKLNKDTHKSDYFTNQEVEQWLEEIKNW